MAEGDQNPLDDQNVPPATASNLQPFLGTLQPPNRFRPDAYAALPISPVLNEPHSAYEVWRRSSEAQGMSAAAGTFSASPQFVGAAAKAEAEFRVVTADGSAAGAGEAHGVGSSIAEATGTATGPSMKAEAGAFRVSSAEGRFDYKAATIRFEQLEVRVRALEMLFRSSRPSSRPGLGHNLGPPITVEDEGDIEHLISLLKQQTPTAVIRRDEVIEAANSASKIAEKIQQYADEFFSSASKKAGEKLGESLFSPTWWLGVSAVIMLVVQAVHSWLSAIPIH